MTFFDLNKGYKVWIFRIGLIAFSLTGIGLIFLLVWYGWEDDKFKRQKGNHKLKGKLEKFYYLYGWFMVIFVLFIFLLELL